MLHSCTHMATVGVKGLNLSQSCQMLHAMHGVLILSAVTIVCLCMIYTETTVLSLTRWIVTGVNAE